MMNRLAAGCVAEFLGTFAFVFFGCGSIIMTHPDLAGGSAGLITVAMAHGLVMFVFVTACMYISGAQFNPAVSVGLVIAGKQDLVTAASYIVVQLVAAVVAVALLMWFLGRDIADAKGINLGATLGTLSKQESVAQLIVFEAILTFALMFVILAAVADQRAHRLGGAGVGLVIAACILAAGPATGASMNPARSFGPALFGHWDVHYAYWLGPMLGAIVAAAVYRGVFEDRSPPAAAVPLHEGDSPRKT